MAKKNTSRSARWNSATSNARSAFESLQSAFEELDGIRGEYEEWKDNLPENLQASALGEKLDAVCELEFDGALGDVEELVNNAEGIDLPRGFGGTDMKAKKKLTMATVIRHLRKQGTSPVLIETLQTLEQERRDARTACFELIDAYETGRQSGGSVDWSDLDDAHAAACDAVGLVRAEEG